MFCLMRLSHGPRHVTGVARATMHIWRWRITIKNLIFCEGCMISIALKVAMPSVLGSMVNLIMPQRHGTVTPVVWAFAHIECHGRTESRTETTPNTASSCGSQGLMVWPTTTVTKQCRPYARQFGMLPTNFCSCCLHFLPALLC